MLHKINQHLPLYILSKMVSLENRIHEVDFKLVEEDLH